MNERIQEIILNLGIKKAEFARRLKISRPFVSELCSGVKLPSNRTIADICREFNVSEEWLRTGEGEMFKTLSKEEELSAFLGDLLSDKPDFRYRFISVLAKMSIDEWKILEKKIMEIAGK